MSLNINDSLSIEFNKYLTPIKVLGILVAVQYALTFEKF